MKHILSNYTASITELKKSPTKLLNESGGEEIAILNHHVPCAYLVPRKLFEKMIDIVDDYYLSQEIEKVLNDKQESIKVNIDDL
jgi:antitoxin StbD